MPTVLPEDSPLRVFSAHAVYVNGNHNGQAIGTCPFCDKEDKFYVNTQSGLYNCFHCNETGNPIQFLRTFHRICTRETSEEQYQELARERKYLTIDLLTQYGFAYNHLREEWVVPGFHEQHKQRKQSTNPSTNPSSNGKQHKEDSGNDNHNDSSNLKQLYRWTDWMSKDGKNHLQATPSFGHCLYGIREFDHNKSDVYICEGPWDAMSLIEVLRITKVDEEGNFEYTGNESVSLFKNINVLAIPSVNMLNDEWLSFLSGKRVFLLLDNDYPQTKEDKNGKKHVEEPSSWKAYQRIVRKIMQSDFRPESIRYLHWGKNCKEDSYNPNLNKGYDVRDLLGKGYTKSLFETKNVDERVSIIEQRISNLKKLYEYIEEVPEKWIDPTISDSDIKPRYSGKKHVSLRLAHCESWNDLVNQWKEVIVWHNGVDKTLSVMLAAIASVPIPKTQLWIRLISDPSSGKSVLCDAVCTNEQFVTMQSNIRGFFSGMRPSKKQSAKGMEDLGLIEDINFKAFVTKDADPILQQPDRARIMAEARDLFDGKTSTHFRTGMGSKYPIIRTVWIMCGTNSIRQIDENDLGGRYLDCELVRAITPKLRHAIIDSAFDSMFSAMDQRVTRDNIESLDTPAMLLAKKMTGGYIQYLCTQGARLIHNIQENTRTKDGGKFYQNAKLMIHCLAELVAKMRTRPGKRDEFITEELPARLAEQFTRLSMCLTMVLNLEYITPHVLSRVAEIGYDTAQGSVFAMTKYLYNHPEGAIHDTLWKVVKREDKEFKQLLVFLVRLKAFNTTDESQHSMKGYGGARFTLSPELRRICDEVFPYMEHLL